MAAAGQSRASELEKLDPRSISSSKSVTETVNGSTQFIVQGYSFLKDMVRGTFVSSGTFSVAGYGWKIRFYPSAADPDGGRPAVRAAIVFPSCVEDDNVNAVFELMLLDQSGEGNSHSRKQQCAPYALKPNIGRLWDFHVRKAHLEKFLKDDCLIIHGSVGVSTTRLEAVVDQGAANKQDDSIIAIPGSNLGQGLKELLESELGCDVVFRVGDETLRAHKSILAARSPFFRAQFFGSVGDPNNLNEIIVDDIHPSIFKAMLVFVYTDELPDLQDIMGSSSSTMSSEATNVMQHLLVAADLYNLNRLKVFCESKLCEKLSASSVATTLVLAEQHHCAQLKAACLKFAMHPANRREMMESEGFKHLKKSCLRELMKAIA